MLQTLLELGRHLRWSLPLFAVALVCTVFGVSRHRLQRRALSLAQLSGCLLAVASFSSTQSARAVFLASLRAEDGLSTAYASIELRVLLSHVSMLLVWSLSVVTGLAWGTLQRRMDVSLEALPLLATASAGLCSSCVLLVSDLVPRLEHQRLAGFFQSESSQVAQAVVWATRRQGTHTLLVTVVVSICAAACALLRRRRLVGEHAQRSPVPALALLAVGGTCFLVSRDVARDARHPLSWDNASNRASPCYARASEPVLAALPELSSRRYRELEYGPLLAFGADGTIDYRESLVVPPTRSGEDGLREALTDFKRRWHSLHRGQRDTTALVVRAPASVAVAALSGPLSIAAELGWETVAVCGAPRERKVVTMTLGSLERRAGSATTLHLRVGAQALTGFARWGDLAHAADGNGGALTVAVSPRTP